MSSQRSITLDGLLTKNVIFIILNIAMIAVGAYLTNHYFDTMFRGGLAEANSLCNISEFWGCDGATKSAMGTLFGVPTSIFAIVMGLCGLLAAFSGKESFERGIKLALAINLAACLALFVYSLAVLGTLCPMCTVYYALSAAAFFLFFKYSDYKMSFDITSLAAFAAIFIIPSAIAGYSVHSKHSENSAQAQLFVDEFNKLKDYGTAPFESPYKLHSATDNFTDAPIRVTLFSDFQCPFCKSVATQFDEIMEAYKDTINVEYMFYPLDSQCNTEMKYALHPYACRASYLAACDIKQFKNIHDFIFKNQTDVSAENLKKWEADFGLSGCMEDKDLQDIVTQSIETGKFYKVKSTPTMIINGKKIEGGLSTPMLKAILDSIVKK